MFLVLGIFSLARRAFLEKRLRISDLALRKKNQNDTRGDEIRTNFRDHELESIRGKNICKKSKYKGAQRWQVW